MARRPPKNVTNMLPHINVPTLLFYVDPDVRRR